jgi:hypothetical protein
MRLAGRVFRTGRFWAIEVPILGVVTQGRTKADAYVMIADAIESLVHRRGFAVRVWPGKGEYFEVGANREDLLIALLLRRQRAKRGLTLSAVAGRMGAKSPNAYARYEQGTSVPTVGTFGRLLRAVAPDTDFVLREAEGR